MSQASEMLDCILRDVVNFLWHKHINLVLEQTIGIEALSLSVERTYKKFMMEEQNMFLSAAVECLAREEERQ